MSDLPNPLLDKAATANIMDNHNNVDVDVDREYTPGSRGWSRLRDRMLAVAKNRAKMTFFSGGLKKLPKKILLLHISSSYAKILGETNFHAREIPRSG